MAATLLSTVDRARSLHFMAHPQLWPFWPYLPVVRRSEGVDEELGVLFDALGTCSVPGYSATVFLTNLFDLPTPWSAWLALAKEVFDETEEIVNAGWSVD